MDIFALLKKNDPICRLHTSNIRERRMVIWVTCGDAELVSTNPKLSFSFVTMFLNSSTL